MSTIGHNLENEQRGCEENGMTFENDFQFTNKSTTLDSIDSGIVLINPLAPHGDAGSIGCRMPRSIGIHSGLSDRFSPLDENGINISKNVSIEEGYTNEVAVGSQSQRSCESPGTGSFSSDDLDAGDDWREKENNDDEANGDVKCNPSKKGQQRSRHHGPLKRHQAVEIRVSECSENLPCFETTLNHEDSEKKRKRHREATVEFTKGIRCTDATTAVNVLKTRYRLADVNFRRRHVAWSSQNVSSLLISFSENNFCQRPQIETSISTQLKEINEAIETKNREIEELLKQLLDEQQRMIDEEKLLNETPSVESNAVIKPEADLEDETRKKKSRNPFRRALHAVRKRMSKQDTSRDV